MVVDELSVSVKIQFLRFCFCGLRGDRMGNECCKNNAMAVFYCKTIRRVFWAVVCWRFSDCLCHNKVENKPSRCFWKIMLKHWKSPWPIKTDIHGKWRHSWWNVTPPEKWCHDHEWCHQTTKVFRPIRILAPFKENSKSEDCWHLFLLVSFRDVIRRTRGAAFFFRLENQDTHTE